MTVVPSRTESLNKWLAQKNVPKGPMDQSASLCTWDDRLSTVGQEAHLNLSSATLPNSSYAAVDRETSGLLPQVCFDPRKAGALYTKKRKVSLPAVDLGRMATVREVFADSPTIPGRPPLLERSMSVPSLSLRHISEESNQLTPRATEFSKLQIGHIDQVVAQSEELDQRPTKRSSSLMARELTPLIIPSSVSGAEKHQEAEILTFRREVLALPPRVPPKSPRTESRVSPRTGGPQHSTHSSISTECSVASSSNSSTNLFGRASPQPVTIPGRTGSPRGRSSPMSALKTISPDSLWSKIFRLESPARQSRPSDHLEKQHVRQPDSVPTAHQGGLSEASAVSRGRYKTTDSPLGMGHSHSGVRSPSASKRKQDLPVGFKAAEAPRQVAEGELRNLRRQADEQVTTFEVLQAKDVAMLSKELRQLDDRCEYLQRTYQSLRQGRKSLHARMISYLRSPHMTNFSRESILKQEEALADIDDAIDDWIRKSEQAENRRTRVRQKLLEHVAAALTLRPSGPLKSPNILYEQTPPESPEHHEDLLADHRREVQSIKIYADAGVAALVAEIDEEIEYIGFPFKAAHRMGENFI
ncbi:MAG: hypothetical protein LQ352_001130 [Teloschistes flavicans]|nr:MAG: hypothetical protein LQ352_001130 [Teloschistes flavicans]